jgi:hypothetical protein
MPDTADRPGDVSVGVSAPNVGTEAAPTFAWSPPEGPLRVFFNVPFDRELAVAQLETLREQIRPGSPIAAEFRTRLDEAIHEAQQGTGKAKPGYRRVMEKVGLEKSRFYDAVLKYTGQRWTQVEQEYADRWLAKKSGKQRNPGPGK